MIATTTIILSLEKVQQQAASFVSGDYCRESRVMNMISDISWQSFEEYKAIGCLVLMYKIVHVLVNISTSHLVPSGHQSSHTSDLSYLWLQSNTNCYRSSFFPPTIPEWNSLPLTLHCASSTQSFKTGLSNLNISRIII